VQEIVDALSPHLSPSPDYMEQRVVTTLSANGIIVRPHEASDVEPMFAAIIESMATVGRWMPWCHPEYSIEDAGAFCERSAKAWSTEGDREFGIFDAASGEVLGCVGINQINRVNLLANMGYWVRSSQQRRGIASTAARLVSNFGFSDLGLARIEIVTHPDNVASRRVAEKIGARFECITRNRLQFRNEPRDAAMYSLVKGDLVSGVNR
jgi:ribosomal-protein-serine acetyltransferase